MARRLEIYGDNRYDVAVMKDNIDFEKDFELMQVIAEYLFSTDGEFTVLYRETQKMIEEK